MKTKEKVNELWELFDMLAQDKSAYFIFALANGLLYSSGQLFQTFSLGQVVSLLENRNREGFLTVICLLLFSTVCFIASSFAKGQVGKYTNKMSARIRERVFNKIPRLKASWFDGADSGDLISRVTNDLGVFTPLFSDSIPGVFFFLVYGVISISAALVVNWKLCFVFIICSMGFKWINDIAVARIKNASQSAYERNGQLVERLLIILSGVPVIRLFGLQEKMETEYRKENQEYTVLSVQLESWKGFQNAANALMTSTVVDLAVIAGAWLVLRERISLAELIVLSQLSSSVTMMFRWTGQIFGEAAAAGVAGSRISELLEQEKEPERFLKGKDVQKKDEVEWVSDEDDAVRFENVSFSYGEKRVLSGISFCVKKGKTLALTGESGGGKSTVLKLLLGFYDVDQGSIFLNGKPLDTYTREEARALISYVSQESFLFSDSIYENIRCGRPEAGMEEVKRAARLACADGFIEELPQGYHTLVGERAVRLSGGQKQRIAIARAIIKDAPILLLDEATSALDADSQQQVQQALEQLMKGRSTIMVAHRLSTIRKADEVLVIGSGSCLAKGR